MSIDAWRARRRSHEYHCVLCYESGWLSGDEERKRQREKKRKKRRDWLDWLESDDCSKWPGRWLHLCFPFSPSLYLLPSLTCFLTYTSLSVSLCHPPPPWFHHGNPSTVPLSLSPNGTAISTNAFQTYSSCHITIWWKVHVFLQSPQSPAVFFSSCNLAFLFQCVTLCVNPPSAKRQWSSSLPANDCRWVWW